MTHTSPLHVLRSRFNPSPCMDAHTKARARATNGITPTSRQTSPATRPLVAVAYALMFTGWIGVGSAAGADATRTNNGPLDAFVQCSEEQDLACARSTLPRVVPLGELMRVWADLPPRYQGLASQIVHDPGLEDFLRHALDFDDMYQMIDYWSSTDDRTPATRALARLTLQYLATQAPDSGTPLQDDFEQIFPGEPTRQVQIYGHAPRRALQVLAEQRNPDDLQLLQTLAANENPQTRLLGVAGLLMVERDDLAAPALREASNDSGLPPPLLLELLVRAEASQAVMVKYLRSVLKHEDSYPQYACSLDNARLRHSHAQISGELAQWVHTALQDIEFETLERLVDPISGKTDGEMPNEQPPSVESAICALYAGLIASNQPHPNLVRLARWLRDQPGRYLPSFGDAILSNMGIGEYPLRSHDSAQHDEERREAQRQFLQELGEWQQRDYSIRVAYGLCQIELDTDTSQTATVSEVRSHLQGDAIHLTFHAAVGPEGSTRDMACEVLFGEEARVLRAEWLATG